MLDIRDCETMAMLDLPENEREQLGRCFNALTGSYAELERVDTDNVEPLVTVLDLANVMREDVAVKILTREEILANAPEQYDGYFQVPGTLV